MSLPIDTGTSVTLHFSLALEDGYMVDSNFEGNPATFTVGDGNLLPGFEAVLMGLVDGDEREFTIAPQNAFGQHICQLLLRVDILHEDASIHTNSLEEPIQIHPKRSENVSHRR